MRTTLPLACLVLTVLAFTGTVLSWILRHPEVSGWDQIGYAAELERDLLAKARGGWGALRDSLFLEGRFHPPGVRLLALPLGLAGWSDLTSLRLLSMTMVALSAVVVGLVARLAAGAGAGMLAAAALLVAPVTLNASEEFLSETLLLPALAGLLWCVAREVTGRGRLGNAALLGMCLGAGALARLSFLPQVAPLLALGGLLVLVFDRARLGRLAVAVLVATLVAWPFYALSGGRYVSYARYALTEWHAHELRADGPLGYPGNWAWFVADWAFGPLLALALVFGLGALAWRAWPRRLAPRNWRWPPPQLAIAGCALLLAAPLVVGHFLASNHNPRFLLAALPGLVVAMAIGAQSLPWRSRLGQGGLAFSAGLVAAQAVALAVVGLWPAPPPFAGLSAIHSRPALACDWRPVVGRVAAAQPRLLLIGQHDGFNEVQVAYAFRRLGRDVTSDTLRTTAGLPLLVEHAARAEYVLALHAGNPAAIPYYDESFLQSPASAVQRLDLVPPLLMEQLAEEAGFTLVEEIAAPGPGECRAWLLAR